MADMPETAARALLCEPLQCLDCGEWVVSKDQPEVWIIRAGLTDEFGRATRLMVELRCRRTAGAMIRNFLFTVLVKTAYRIERVYQLEVNQTRKRLKDRHKRSHEHYGDARNLGDDSWKTWDFQEVFRYFCCQTKIEFWPPPHPPVGF